MASTRTLAKSINMSFLQNNNKIIYVSLLVILSFSCFLIIFRECTLIPHGLPSGSFILGLSFALLCGQAHPKFNKKYPNICCSILWWVWVSV